MRVTSAANRFALTSPSPNFPQCSHSVTAIYRIFAQVRAQAELITTRWQELMLRTEERMKLVVAAHQWFKTAEQVRAYIFTDAL